MELTNPMTGEVIDTAQPAAEWAATALDWLDMVSQAKDLERSLRDALGALVPRDKMTEHYDDAGVRFTVVHAHAGFEPSALRDVLDLQDALAEDKRPVVARTVLEVSRNALRALANTHGETAEAIRQRLDDGKKPLGPPRIKRPKAVSEGMAA